MNPARTDPRAASEAVPGWPDTLEAVRAFDRETKERRTPPDDKGAPWIKRGAK